LKLIAVPAPAVKAGRLERAVLAARVERGDPGHRGVPTERRERRERTARLEWMVLMVNPALDRRC
jgi:hypothetical protein